MIMPVIGAITGGLDFSNYFEPLSHNVTSHVLVDAKKQGAVLAWGNFATIVINFLIVAFVLFLVVRGINMLRTRIVQEKKVEEAAAPPTKEEVLLTEIRDLLAKSVK
jgi:large conductance mechanosensitive channel